MPRGDEIYAPVCRHFSRNGKCTGGRQCRFLHEGEPTAADPTGKVAARLADDIRKQSAAYERVTGSQAPRAPIQAPPIPKPWTPEPEYSKDNPPPPPTEPAPKALPGLPSTSTALVGKDDPGNGVLVDARGGRPIGDTSSGSVYVSDLPKNFQGGEEALHFALGELFGQFGKIKKIELYMEEGILETQNFKGEALVVYHPSKKMGTRDKSDPVYMACSELDGKYRKLGFRMWRLKCEPAAWQKDGYNVKNQAKKAPCVQLNNLWEYDSSMPLSWFAKIQDVIREHAIEQGVKDAFVKVDPCEGGATVWCKGAQDAMKFAAVMHKSWFLGRKVISTLCRKERPVQEHLPKLPPKMMELTMKTPAQLAAERAARGEAEFAAEELAGPDAKAAEEAAATTTAAPLTESKEAEEPAGHLTFLLGEGTKVVLKGLVAKPENNGQLAEVLSYLADVQKYQLRLVATGKTVKVKPENIEPVVEEAPIRKKRPVEELHVEEEDEAMDSDEAEGEASKAMNAAELMAAGKVKHGDPAAHDPNRDGFMATVCVDPELLPKREEASQVETRRRESSRSRERRFQERIEASKARLAVDKGPRPSWVVSGPPLDLKDNGAGGGGGAQGGGGSLPKEPEQSREELMKLSVGKLKELLKEFGKSAKGLVEKRDFVDRLKPPPKV